MSITRVGLNWGFDAPLDLTAARFTAVGQTRSGGVTVMSITRVGGGDCAIKGSKRHFDPGEVYLAERRVDLEMFAGPSAPRRL